MTRYEDWPVRLNAYIESRRQMPFAWRDNDCCSFAIGAVEALTGERVWTVDWEPTEESAMAAIEAAGGLVAAISKALGPAGQNWRMAARGDIVLGEIDGRRVPMLVVGDQLCGPGFVIGVDGAVISEGLVFKPLREARLVWKT